MSILTNCPVDASLPDIPLGCDVNIGQIQKFIVQRIFSTGTTKNKFVKASANPNLKASWIPVLSAANGTKAVQTPFLVSPVITPGKSVLSGGGNDSLSGAEKVIGKEPSSFAGAFKNLNLSTEAALQSLMGETIGIYPIDEHGFIYAEVDDIDTPTAYFPIPVRTFFIGDREAGKYNTEDSNEISFKLLQGWSNKLARIEPTDFDALTDLATITS